MSLIKYKEGRSLLPGFLEANVVAQSFVRLDFLFNGRIKSYGAVSLMSTSLYNYFNFYYFEKERFHLKILVFLQTESPR